MYRNYRLNRFAPLLFAIGTATVVHWIPSSYRVHQRFEIEGSASNLTGIIQKSLSEMKMTPTSLSCRLSDTKQQVDCSFVVETRSQSKRLTAFLRDRLPNVVGWTDATTVDAKIRETKSSIDKLSEQFSVTDAEYNELRKTAGVEEEVLNQVSIERGRLENELANRGKQLEILDDAIATGRDPQTLQLFQAKRADVARVIETLRQQSQEVEKRYEQAMQPRVKRKGVDDRLTSLRNDIDLSRARLAAWSALRQNQPESKTLPDPDAFRLKALPTDVPIKPIRTLAHLLWSFPLGFLGYAALRRRWPSWFQSPTFATPQEIESATGLPFLGNVS